MTEITSVKCSAYFCFVSVLDQSLRVPLIFRVT